MMKNCLHFYSSLEVGTKDDGEEHNSFYWSWVLEQSSLVFFLWLRRVTTTSVLIVIVIKQLLSPWVLMLFSLCWQDPLTPVQLLSSPVSSQQWLTLDSSLLLEFPCLVAKTLSGDGGRRWRDTSKLTSVVLLDQWYPHIVVLAAALVDNNVTQTCKGTACIVVQMKEDSSLLYLQMETFQGR